MRIEPMEGERAEGAVTGSGAAAPPGREPGPLGIPRPLLHALQLLLTVGVTWFIFRRLGVGLEELAAVDVSAWDLRWGMLAVASGVLLVGYLVSAALWGVMVGELGGPRVPLEDAVRVFLLANLGRYLPGKLWQVAGLAWLGRDLGVPPGLSAAAAVLGQATALLGAAAVGALALLRAPGGGVWGGALLAGAAVGVLLLSIPPVFRALVRFGYRKADQGPPSSLLRDRTFLLRWVGLYAVNWGLYAASFWLFAVGLGQGAALLVAGPAFAAAYVLGYLAFFAPAGLGVREGFLTAFLRPALGAGPAGVVAVAARVWTTGVEVVPAAVLGAGHLLRRSRGKGG